MKKTICLFLLLVLFRPVFADQITNVAILDVNKVYSIYFRESKAVKELQARQAEVLAKLNQIDQEILALESEKLSAVGFGNEQKSLRLDQEIFDKKQYRQDYYRIKIKQLRSLQEQLSQSEEFVNELYSVIQYVAESGGYSLVFNSSEQFNFYLYTTKEIDITEEVIQELMRRAGQSYSGWE